MEITATAAYIGRSVNIGRRGYPMMPTVKSLDISFGSSELVLTGPEPARITIEAWWPDWARAQRPELRDVVLVRLGDGTREATTFAGRVDGVERRRRHAPASEIARRQPEPTRLYRTSWRPVPPYEALDRVSGEWWQSGAPKLYAGFSAGEVWTPRAIPVVVDDGVLDNALPVEYRLPLDARDIPAGATLYAAERLTVPIRSGWQWLVNGTLTPVADGPITLPGAPPADLALVYPNIEIGADYALPELHAPAILPAGYKPNGILPAGEWVTITASDWLSEAGRMKIGMTPQPADEPAARWDSVRARAEQLDLHVPIADAWDSATWRTYADSRLRPDAMSYGAVAARDVDNQPIAGLLSDAIAGLGAALIATEQGIYPWRARRLPSVLSPAGVVTDNAETVAIPASVVSEQALELRVTDVVNKVRLSYVDKLDGETERTLTLSWDQSIKLWGESSTSWSTQQLANPADVEDAYGLGSLVDRIRNAVSAMSSPAYRFTAPIVLTPARLAKIPAGVDVLALVDVETRHGMPLSIEHDIPDAPTRYALKKGSIVIDEGRTIITLEPEPGGFSGAVGLQFAAIALKLPALTFAQLDPALTFTDTVRIGVPE